MRLCLIQQHLLRPAKTRRERERREKENGHRCHDDGPQTKITSINNSNRLQYPTTNIPRVGESLKSITHHTHAVAWNHSHIPDLQQITVGAVVRVLRKEFSYILVATETTNETTTRPMIVGRPASQTRFLARFCSTYCTSTEEIARGKRI